MKKLIIFSLIIVVILSLSIFVSAAETDNNIEYTTQQDTIFDFEKAEAARDTDNFGSVIFKYSSENSYIESYESDSVNDFSEDIVSETETSVPEKTDPIKVKYDFESLNNKPDDNGVMVFTPVDVYDGWLFELSGGESIEVSTGSIITVNGDFGERYIDIKGINGSVRFLCNSFSTESDNINNTKTQFWSAKQQVGNSIVKDFNGEIYSAILFERENNSKFLLGYTENGNNNFWGLPVPENNYFIFNAE